MNENHFPIENVTSGGVEYRAYRMPYQNLYETLVASATSFPDKVALIEGDETVTYSEFLRRTNALAAYLSGEAHVRRGNRVALIMVNSVAFCVSFYAILKLGATMVSVNSKYSGEEMAFILRDAEVSCVIADRAWIDKIPADALAGRRMIFSDSPLGGCITVSQAIARGAQLPDVPVVLNDALPANLMYTSGTTGKPKGALMTHFNLLQGLYVYVEADDMDEREITVLSIPAFHITGLNNVLTVFVFVGGTIVLLPFFNAEETLDAITKYRATYLHAVATVFMLLEGAVKPRHVLSSLHTALCGGGFISREAIRNFCAKAVNCRFHPVYGMTETSGAGSYFAGHCLDSDIEDSCGRVAANCEIRIVDSADNVLPPNVMGEICFRGAFVIRSYLHGVSPESFTDDWLHSGDVGYFDEQGYLYIKDRIKDMINRGGEKIYSLAIEDAIMKFGGIKQACVFGVPDKVFGEVPGAVVIPEEGVTINTDALRSFLRDRIAHYKVPVFFDIRDVLPTTASGKPRKYQLRAEYAAKRNPNS